MTAQLAIGVDMGGTKIAFALITRQGEVLATHRLPTDPTSGPDAVMDRIAEGVGVLLAQASLPVAGVGVGSPGHVDPLSGIVHHAVNLGWHDVPLVAGLHQRLNAKIPIMLQKDTNAAALGEMVFGAARGYRDFVYLGVGTGLGGGAVIDGRVVIGTNAYAMEVGHIALDPGGRRCTCGMRGCPEIYVSGMGLLAGVREHRADYPDSPLAQHDDPTTPMIVEAARGGDPLARVVMDEAAQWLGATMACCATLFNPALFVVGGGLGRAAADLLLPGAEAELQRRVMPAACAKLHIVESQITISAVGAGSLVWYDPPTR